MEDKQNREYLFKGKKSSNMEWKEGSLLVMNGKAFIYPYDWGDLDDIDFGFGFHEVVTETVGQYIGFPDIKGKNIFTGDICRRPGGITGVVVYDIIHARYGLSVPQKCTDQKMRNIPIPIATTSKLEVIGNTHDKENL